VVRVRTRTAAPGFRLEAAPRTEAHANPTEELSDREGGGGGRGAAAEEARDGGVVWVTADPDPDLEMIDDEHSRLERRHDFGTASCVGAEGFLAAGLNGASGLGLLRSISRRMLRLLAEGTMAGWREQWRCMRVVFGGEGKTGVRFKQRAKFDSDSESTRILVEKF
jgi:hypothetical protein